MQLDEFESIFRSSVKPRYHFAPQKLQRILLVTESETEAQGSLERCKRFFSRSLSLRQPQKQDSTNVAEDILWETLHQNEFPSVSKILDRVRRNPPDLLLCTRHVLGDGESLPYSLGTTVDTLTQATDVPVLLLPDPWKLAEEQTARGTERVMVVTDHLTGDDALVNWGVHMCSSNGQLFLTHIEDEEVLAKYLDICAKIPGLPSEIAEAKIPKKLLDMPTDYIATIVEVLAQENILEEVLSVVEIGNPVKRYQALVTDKDIDLLVMNTKDPGQSAMHGLAYALAVEIRDRPLLLL